MVSPKTWFKATFVLFLFRQTHPGACSNTDHWWAPILMSYPDDQTLIRSCLNSNVGFMNQMEFIFNAFKIIYDPSGVCTSNNP